MNKVILMGRLTRDPEVRYSQGENATAVARFTLAVDRRIKRDNEASVDYINCVSLEDQQSSQKSISIKVQRLQLLEGFKQEAIRIKMDRRYIQQI